MLGVTGKSTFRMNDKSALLNKSKVLYLGPVDSYSDADGKRHYAEICQYMTMSYSLASYCHSHNKVR